MKVIGIVIEEDDGRWVSGVEVVIDGRSYFYAHDVTTARLDWAVEGAANMAAAVRWGANVSLVSILERFR